MSSLFPLLFSQEYAVECMIREVVKKAKEEVKKKFEEEYKIEAILEMIENGATDFEKIKASGCFSERILQAVEAKMTTL